MPSPTTTESPFHRYEAKCACGFVASSLLTERTLQYMADHRLVTENDGALHAGRGFTSVQLLRVVRP